MRSVVVTVLPLPDPPRDRHGIFRRLGVFLKGINRVSEQVEIIQFAPASEAIPAARIEAVSTAFWGMPVKVSILPLNVRPRRVWQAVSLPFAVRYRRDFRPYLGPAQLAALGRLLEAPATLIFAHRLAAMTALLRLPPIQAPIFFDLDDVEHQVKWRAAQTAPSKIVKLRNAIEIPALLAAERLAVLRAARTFVCSDLDRTVLSGLNFDISRTSVVSNATEIPEDRPGLSPSQSVLFLGNYGYAPNAEAAERLISRIWPRVRSQAPAARLIVAGDRPQQIPSYHSRPPGVEFTGFVDDLDALYARVRIVCCPINNGGGTRIKVIEAAAYGKPIVATAVAIEGLSFVDGRDLVIRDADSEMASACARLLNDDALADGLGASAHRRARSLYSVASLPDQIAEEIRAGLIDDAAIRDPADGAPGSRDRLDRLRTATDAEREGG